MRTQVQSLASPSGFRIWRCRELWTWLGSDVAVALAQAGGYRSDSTPSLGTSICCGCGPGKDRKTKKRNFTSKWFFKITSELDFFFFVFLPFLGLLLVAYGGSQARSLIGAVAFGLCQSHSKAGSELRLQPTPLLMATPDP